MLLDSVLMFLRDLRRLCVLLGVTHALPYVTVPRYLRVTSVRIKLYFAGTYHLL